ncbi:hypothetical protein AERO9AM_10248 [Aeromicrobium sp. 9AM]|nr:hypothetical protein AERO9AM_10248 [Aeromicrobium sp. 9AM]
MLPDRFRDVASRAGFDESSNQRLTELVIEQNWVHAVLVRACEAVHFGQVVDRYRLATARIPRFARLFGLCDCLCF